MVKPLQSGTASVVFAGERSIQVFKKSFPDGVLISFLPNIFNLASYTSKVIFVDAVEWGDTFHIAKAIGNFPFNSNSSLGTAKPDKNFAGHFPLKRLKLGACKYFSVLKVAT